MHGADELGSAAAGSHGGCSIGGGPASAGDPLRHVSFLTFGCVLRRLYGRYFPVYFGAQTLLDVGHAVDGRWWNLWRYTDYVGGPVLAGPPPVAQPPWNPAHALPHSSGPCVDLHLIDPPFDRPPGDPAEPPAKRHSDFWTVPEFQIAASRLAELIPGPLESDVGGNA